MSVTLFLDFDGVMHPFFPLPDLPYEENAFFSYWPRLKSVLDDFPDVDVVISSSWRTSESLMAQVPATLRLRIVGYTPEIKRRTRKQYPAHFVPEPIRYLEIQRYLKSKKLESAQWIALDDDPLLFRADCPQLLLCPTGFGVGEEIELRRRLEQTANTTGCSELKKANAEMGLYDIPEEEFLKPIRRINEQ